MDGYAAVHQRSITDPARFWGMAAREVHWLVPPDRVLDDGAPPFYRWFTGGELNVCDNALDRHVAAGHGDRPALIYPGGAAGPPQVRTFGELAETVARFAGALAELGVGGGDRVLVHLPLSPDAVVAVLACARLGAVHVVPSQRAGAGELAAQIDLTRPKAVVAAAGEDGTAKPVLESALRLASHRIPRRLIRHRPDARMVPPRDVAWEEALAAARLAGCAPAAATDPLHILFAPGPEGVVRGVVRDHGGYAVALRWTMEHIYGAGPGEVFGATCDLGWAAGLSGALHAPLLTGCTLLLHDGGAGFWAAAAEHGAKAVLTTAATAGALRAAGGAPDRAPAAVFLAGRRPDRRICARASRALCRPVTWQWERPETGRPIAAAPHGLEPTPVDPEAAGPPVPGFDVHVLAPDGAPAAAGTDGELAIRLPLPPGSLTTLWRDDERFVAEHLARRPGYFLTGDAGRLGADGHVRVTGSAGPRPC